MSKCFTNGRLRIDFFQPSRRLVEKTRFLGCFCKWLTISELCFWRFPGVANPPNWRCRYTVIASPLQCNRVAVTVQSHCRYGVTATPFGYYRKKIWPKIRCRSCQRAEGYPFSALFAPVPKC